MEKSTHKIREIRRELILSLVAEDPELATQVKNLASMILDNSVHFRTINTMLNEDLTLTKQLKELLRTRA